MRAAWYEKQGPARDVLVVGDMPDPEPQAGEVRIRVEASGVNPGDTKKREDAFKLGMPYPRVIPHSDGAGRIDRVGAGVPREWIGRAVWCFGAQSYRAFGTAAEYTCVPLEKVAPLPANVSMEQGACLGIPGITGHRAATIAGDVRGRTVLVQGAAGAVGTCAVAVARYLGARVIGTIRGADDRAAALKAGASDVVESGAGVVERVRAIAPDGVDHIVEVAFGANIDADVELLKNDGSIASFATNDATPKIPYWQMVFKNLRAYFLGSDDFPPEAKALATRDLNGALESGWPGFDIAERVPLADIARAHELVDHPAKRGRVVVII
jgi:NADPH:quinone reductase